LYRSNDLAEAQAVAVSILAMEFDARLISGAPARLEDGACGPHDDDGPGPPPYSIEVRADHWPDLAEVLPEIIDEQREFDRRCELACAERERKQAALLIVLGGATALPPMLDIVLR
jgi:hypothetical protein